MFKSRIVKCLVSLLLCLMLCISAFIIPVFAKTAEKEIILGQQWLRNYSFDEGLTYWSIDDSQQDRDVVLSSTGGPKSARIETNIDGTFNVMFSQSGLASDIADTYRLDIRYRSSRTINYRMGFTLGSDKVTFDDGVDNPHELPASGYDWQIYTLYFSFDDVYSVDFKDLTCSFQFFGMSSPQGRAYLWIDYISICSVTVDYDIPEIGNKGELSDTIGQSGQVDQEVNDAINQQMSDALGFEVESADQALDVVIEQYSLKELDGFYINGFRFISSMYDNIVTTLDIQTIVFFALTFGLCMYLLGRSLRRS